MKNRLHHIELRKVNVPNSISKEFSINDNKILAWGERNAYPYFLNYLYSKSSIHRGLINGKVEYYKSLINDIKEPFNSNGMARLTIFELIEKLLLDYETKNAFAIKVVKNEFLKTKEFEYVDIDNVRISADGKAFYYSNDWTKGFNVEFEIYPNYFYYKDERETLAVFFADVKNVYNPNTNKVERNYYPEPTYSGAIESILTDIEICHFNLSEIVNGFVFSALITLNNGVPETEDEQERIKSELRKAITDRDKKGGVVIAFSNGKDYAPEIQMLNGSDVVDRYTQLTKDVIQRILIAHNITSPLLVGVKTEGQLGGSTELEIAKEIFEKKYIIPRLKTFINFVNQVFTEQIGLRFSANKCCERVWHDDADLESVLKVFDEFGIEKSKVKLLDEYQEFDLSEDLLINKHQTFDYKLTELQDKVLNLLIQGNSIDEIAKALRVDISIVANIFNKFKDAGLIDKKNRVTDEGKRLASQDEILQIYYEYRVRPGLGEPIIDTTREFCRRLIEKDKVYTRAEIDEISSRVKRDVWYYRGGYYHDPRDGKNYPFCRHYWYQVLGIKKK